MPSKKLIRIDPQAVQTRGSLPGLPPALNNTDYEGWIPEWIKQKQIAAYRKTQAERLAVLTLINQIQGQCMALARNENDWRHFGQEDRLRQKRLDVEELELDMKMEELQERRRRAKEPVVIPKPPERPDPIREALNRLRSKIRTGVEARSECDHLKREFPEYALDIEREFRKMISDLREHV